MPIPAGKEMFLETVRNIALDAFWEKVASCFPEAKTGDVSPEMLVRFEDSAKSIINEWITMNVPDFGDVE